MGLLVKKKKNPGIMLIIMKIYKFMKIVKICSVTRVYGTVYDHLIMEN